MTAARLFLLLPLLSALSFPQVSDLASEPHHQLLLENDQARVFTFKLPPTESAYALHSRNFLLITLTETELVIWREGQSAIQNFRLGEGDIRFLFGGEAIGFRNDRSQQYRGVLVEFLNKDVTSYGYQQDRGKWDFGASVMPPPVDPHAPFNLRLRLGAADAHYVQLLPGGELEPPAAEGSSELLIALTDSELKLGRNRWQRAPGEAVWLGAGRKDNIHNEGAHPVRFALIELK